MPVASACCSSNCVSKAHALPWQPLHFLRLQPFPFPHCCSKLDTDDWRDCASDLFRVRYVVGRRLSREGALIICLCSEVTSGRAKHQKHIRHTDASAPKRKSHWFALAYLASRCTQARTRGRRQGETQEPHCANGAPHAPSQLSVMHFNAVATQHL